MCWMISSVMNVMVLGVQVNLHHSSAPMSHVCSITASSAGLSFTQEQDVNSTNPWSKKAPIGPEQCHSDGKDVCSK